MVWPREGWPDWLADARAAALSKGAIRVPPGWAGILKGWCLSRCSPCCCVNLRHRGSRSSLVAMSFHISR